MGPSTGGDSTSGVTAVRPLRGDTTASSAAVRRTCITRSGDPRPLSRRLRVLPPHHLATVLEHPRDDDVEALLALGRCAVVALDVLGVEVAQPGACCSTALGYPGLTGPVATASPGTCSALARRFWKGCSAIPDSNWSQRSLVRSDRSLSFIATRATSPAPSAAGVRRRSPLRRGLRRLPRARGRLRRPGSGGDRSAGRHGFARGERARRVYVSAAGGADQRA